MSARVLRYTVVVRHPDTSVATALLAGSEVPDWAKDLVHSDDLVPDAAEKKTTAKKSASSKTEQ